MFPLYLINGFDPILIDTGVTHLAPQTLSRIQEITPHQKIKKLFLTHTHWDHVGGLAAIVNEHHTEVFASGYGSSLLEKQPVIDFIKRMNRLYSGSRVVPPECEIGSPIKTIPLFDNNVIPIDDQEKIRVLETPGHTRCSLSYYLEQSSVLFPGDALGVVEKNGIIRPLFLSDFTAYLNSIKKLSELPVEVLALPHNHVISGQKNCDIFFSNALNATREFFEHIAHELKSCDDEERIASSIIKKHFLNSTIQGPLETFKINVLAMIRAVEKTIKK